MAMKKKYKIIILILAIFVILGLFYTFFIQIRHVNAGEIGVKSSLSENNVHSVKGYVVFMPLYTDLAIYPTTIQVISYDSIPISSKDGIRFHVKPSISYQLNESKVTDLYKMSRSPFSTLNNGYLKDLVAAIYSSTANIFDADSLATNERIFNKLAYESLAVKMEQIGLTLMNTVSNLEYPESIKSAIAIRMKTLQEALIAENKLRYADALRKEDSLRFSALTPLAIQKMFIDKWDGKMPPYTTNGISRIYDSINNK